jgi:hypothetical protein
LSTYHPDGTPLCGFILKREAMATNTIDHGTLSHLVEAGAVRSIHIVGQSGGWFVMVRYGMIERPLTAQRTRQARLFRKFETLVSYLRTIGIVRFDVDAANYDPDTLKAKPDRAEALKQTHEAAAYDKWFRAQVQASIDDPRPSIPHEQVMADTQALIDDKRLRHAAKS